MRKLKIYLILIAMAFVAFAGCKEKGTEPQSNETSTLTYNGYTYKIVKIGNQWWLAENLRTTRYNDGTNIPYIGNLDQWELTQESGYCYYEYNSLNREKYGNLYNYYAIETGKLAPTGWRVPTKEDYEQLINYCGGEVKAAEKLMAKTSWFRGNGSDAYGFCALAGGMVTPPFSINSSEFIYEEISGYWWSATNNEYLVISSYPNNVKEVKIHNGWGYLKNTGMSIRLIME